MQVFDRAERARFYQRHLPFLAVGVMEPWWWAALACGSNLVNLRFPDDLAIGVPSTLAIIARGAPRGTVNPDVEAIARIMDAEGQLSSLHAYYHGDLRKARDRFVGLVTVRGVVRDQDAAGLWFSGPDAVQISEPLLLPEGHRPRSQTIAPADTFTAVSERERLDLEYHLGAIPYIR